MIPANIKILHGKLPDEPGVYFYFDRKDQLLYVGKATSLRWRVGSYFTKAHSDRLGEMVSQISRIEYVITPTVIEALVLEANQIKAKKPKYNILMRDDKSFLYLIVTKEDFPRPQLVRGHELEQMGTASIKKFLRVFGPYTSSVSLKKAMDLIRRAIPWTLCQPPSITGRTRPCFDAHIRKCPGVCTGVISKTAYRRIMRQFILFFEGKKKQIVRSMEKQMKKAADELRFEDAGGIRRHLYALQHISDVALISKEDSDLPYTSPATKGMIDLQGRIEGYDISNISGTFAVGSLVVFEEGKPSKDKYRKFKIKTVRGVNDVAMLEEMLVRRLARATNFPNAWPLPQLMVIDGGEGQVQRAQQVLDEFQISVSLIGIAKGFDRKQDRLVFDHSNLELLRVAKRGQELFQRIRDEAHRFAVRYHRQVRSKNFLS